MPRPSGPCADSPLREACTSAGPTGAGGLERPMMQSAWRSVFGGVSHSARESESGRHLDDGELRRSLGGSSDHSDLDEQAGNEVRAHRRPAERRSSRLRTDAAAIRECEPYERERELLDALGLTESGLPVELYRSAAPHVALFGETELGASHHELRCPAHPPCASLGRLPRAFRGRKRHLVRRRAACAEQRHDADGQERLAAEDRL